MQISMNYVLKALILIMACCFYNVLAQENDKKTFELLTLEIEMYSSYGVFSDESRQLIKQAADYAKQNEYDLAVVFLEEALTQIKSPQEKEAASQNINDGSKFYGNIISGIDYNRQEFELGFEQSDSVLLDQLSKPFVGFDVIYESPQRSFNIENTFRYDSENLRNELFFRNIFDGSTRHFESRYGGIIDRNYEYEDLGYYELFAEMNLKSTYKNSDWYWQLKNYSRYKKFKNPSVSVPSFFRNSFSAFLGKNFDFYNDIQFDYIMDLNESLDFDNNDFIEHNSGISYKDIFFGKLKIEMASRYRYFNFNYQLSDSSFENTSHTVSINPGVIYDFSAFLSFDIDYNIDIKTFTIKTEQEPDYTYNYINPALVIATGDLSSIRVGYVYEKKSHVAQEGLVKQYIRDQDYYASGFSAAFDYTALKGMIISLSAEYSRRRYPHSSSDTDFSIYSNRNILSLLLYAQVPLYKNIGLNLIAAYDNDKDIDSDFNDTVSSFYTAELSYSF
jgi:hypothetical protein